MTDFNERIAKLAELEAKATPGEWEGYDLSFCDHFLEQIISCCNGEKQILSLKHENSENNQQLICALRNKALPLLRDMQKALSEAQTERDGLKDGFLDHVETDSYQRIVKYAAHVKDLYRWEKEQKEYAQAENERLRQGIKDVAEKYAEMEKLRSQFYTEKEQVETALLFANRENERLRAGIARAVDNLKKAVHVDSVYPLHEIYKELEAQQNDA